jgi:hypothetical protein
MASSYVNDLRLNEMATGDASGTWGDTTNTNLELIAEAFSYGTEAITTNADTHTTTIADGATDPGRSMYLKYTGTLDSACTITIGPNTVSKVWIIENGTSGSQNIILSQGSGANITIPAGDTKVVYSDGAGAGAAFVDAFASLSVVDLKVQDDLTVTDDVIIGGDIDLEGAIDVNGTANLDVVDIDGAVDMASTLQVDGVATFTGRDIHSGGITIANAGQIGSVGDTDAIAIASDGVVTLTQKLVGTELDISGNVDVDGTTETDVLTINGSQFNYKAFGTSSIMIGDTTTGTIDAADNNTGLGVDVFAALTSGDSNVAVGFAALTANTTGSQNVAIGDSCMTGNTSGNFNVAIGHLAMHTSSAGPQRNVAVGYGSLYAISNALYNSAVGMYSLNNVTTGVNNTAMGYEAGDNINTGSSNTGVGFQSLGVVTTGSFNTCIGDEAGSTLASGASNNTCLGYQARTGSTNSSHAIVIGSNITAGASNNRFSFGTASNIVHNNFDTNASWTRTSDERKKKNIKDDVLGLDFINNLRPVTFEWKPNNEFPEHFKDYKQSNEMTTGVTMHGMIAQDVKSALDKAGVDTFGGWEEDSEDGSQAISQEMFVHPLIKAVQELSTQVDELKSELLALKGE